MLHEYRESRVFGSLPGNFLNRFNELQVSRGAAFYCEQSGVSL